MDDRETSPYDDPERSPYSQEQVRPDDRLAGDMRNEAGYLTRGTRRYGWIYYATRVILIVASAIVAADQNLKGTSMNWLFPAVPGLAVLVVILTALDTWLKPQEKWKGFMESRDALADLQVLVSDGNLRKEEARKRFAALRSRHREKNIY